MAFNTGGAMGGAASGAATGSMIAPGIGTGVGAVLGGALGGFGGDLFGGGKSINFNRIKDILAASKDTQNRIGTDYLQSSQGLRDQLLTAMGASKKDASTGLDTASTNYLAELNPLTSQSIAESNKALLRSTLGAVPQAQQQAREALAATTGLGSGYAADTARNISKAGLTNYQTGRTALEQQGLGATMGALTDVFKTQAAQIAQSLGVDEATHNNIMNSGNQALINQYTQALQTERDNMQGQIQAEVGLGNMGMAQDTANQNTLMSGLGALGSYASNVNAQNSTKDFLTKLLGGNKAPAVSGPTPTMPALR